MAPLLRQMRSKVIVAREIASKRSSAFYKQLTEDHNHYVVKPATVQKCQKLPKQSSTPLTAVATSLPQVTAQTPASSALSQTPGCLHFLTPHPGYPFHSYNVKNTTVVSLNF